VHDAHDILVADRARRRDPVSSNSTALALKYQKAGSIGRTETTMGFDRLVSRGGSHNTFESSRFAASSGAACSQMAQ